MTTYAGVVDGWVTQTFTPLPEWSRIPVDHLFAPGVVDQWVPIDGIKPPPAYGWKYAAGAFSPPTGTEDAAALRATMLARSHKR